MSDLQSLLKNLRAKPSNVMSYAYYDKETGKIHKISSKNIPEDGVEILEVETHEVRPIMSGQKRIDEFVILYDVNLKQIRLKELSYEDTNTIASTMCYQIPAISKKETNTESLEYDVIIQQDTINKVWNIILNDSTHQFLLRDKYVNEILYFSITSKYDPNILYRSLKFSVADLYSQNTINIPFKYELEYDTNNVSIYTSKYFDSYVHEVI